MAESAPKPNLKAALAGHEDLLRRFTRLRGYILGYLRLLVRDNHLAEDLYQETSLVVMRKMDQFDRARSFDAWVRGIARNLARNAMRRKRAALMPSPQLLEAIELSYKSGTDAERDLTVSRLEHLHDCVEKLSSRNKALLRLRYGNGTAFKDIARTAGRSTEAVRVALTRVRQFLLRCIQQRENAITHGA